jgi:hypothetical protein
MMDAPTTATPAIVSVPKDRSFPVFTLLVAIASAVVSGFALKNTLDLQYYPSLDSLLGAEWHCGGGCERGQHDSVSQPDPRSPLIVLDNGRGGGTGQSNAVYDRNSGTIETVGRLPPGSVSDGDMIPGWGLSGRVSHDGKLIIWRPQKGTTTENNKTFWWRE